MISLFFCMKLVHFTANKKETDKLILLIDLYIENISLFVR